ncbi:MAG TPA: hypothetical protein VNA28_00225 [Solirubrobacteraceae bacterium]|nr:hypothetical protein [Solirubrobacteraceae bacterium]
MVRLRQLLPLAALGALAVAGGAAVDQHSADGADGRAAADATLASPRIAAPAPPRAYRLPPRAVRVRTSAGLARALARRAPTAIVLAPGSYDRIGATTPYFEARTGHRLYAERRGRAVLRAGLEIGGNDGRSGGRVQGLVFDVTARYATQDAVLHIWGVVGRRTTVLDTTFHGDGAVGTAILALQPAGLTVRRVRIRAFRDNGVRASDNDPSSQARIRAITDVDVRGVKRSPAGSCDGRCEFGVWIGHRVRRPVERIRIRDFGWSGLWTGNRADDLRLRDLDIDGSARPNGNAVYLEHTTRRAILERFRLGPDIQIGIISEWDYGTLPTGAGVDNVIRHGLIRMAAGARAKRAGVVADDGTERMTITHVSFRGCGAECIVDRGRATRIAGNDYDGARGVGAGR